MKYLALAFLVSLAAAWAPLVRMEKPVEGSYIVIFNENAPDMPTVGEIEKWLNANFNGISGVVKSAWFIEPENGTPKFRGFAAALTVEQVQVLQLSKDLAFIEEDSIVKIDPIFENDTRFVKDDASDWGIDRVDSRCSVGSTSNPCGGKSNDCTGANTNVYVVDTGVRTTHTQFGGRARIAANYAAGDPSPYNGDCNGHGTHVASSVAGKDYGVAKAAQIYSVRVLNCQGSGTNANVIDGINYVGNVAKTSGKRYILSASVGGGASTATNNAIDATAGKGVTCIVAAGNDNANACNYSPASASQAITVGATDKTDTRSSFSNYGSCVDIFAPGSSITGAWYTSDTALNTISGTSMATPIVSGSLAVISTSVGSTYSTIKSQISSYATKAVVKNPGSGSNNFLAYDRWNDGTSTTC